MNEVTLIQRHRTDYDRSAADPTRHARLYAVEQLEPRTMMAVDTAGRHLTVPESPVVESAQKSGG